MHSKEARRVAGEMYERRVSLDVRTIVLKDSENDVTELTFDSTNGGFVMFAFGNFLLIESGQFGIVESCDSGSLKECFSQVWRTSLTHLVVKRGRLTRLRNWLIS